MTESIRIFAVMGHCELALLRAACAGQAPFAAVRGVSEGLEHRLEKRRAGDRKPARFAGCPDHRALPPGRGCGGWRWMRRWATTARPRRLPPYLHLLGARKEALSLPGETALPLSHSLAPGWHGKTRPAPKWLLPRAEPATLVRCAGQNRRPMGGIYRQKIIFLTN